MGNDLVRCATVQPCPVPAPRPSNRGERRHWVRVVRQALRVHALLATLRRQRLTNGTYMCYWPDSREIIQATQQLIDGVYDGLVSSTIFCSDCEKEVVWRMTKQLIAQHLPPMYALQSHRPHQFWPSYYENVVRNHTTPRLPWDPDRPHGLFAVEVIYDYIYQFSYPQPEVERNFDGPRSGPSSTS